MKLHSGRRCASLLLLGALVAAAAAQEQVPGTRRAPAGAAGQDPLRRPQEPVLQPQQPRDPYAHPFNPADTGIAPFQGFPLFPPELGGYGGYPAPPRGLLEPPTVAAGATPPPLLPLPPDWPSWVGGRHAEEIPYAPDKAVLVRQSDRVWFSTEADPVLVPLYFWDKFRALGAGSRVQVRQSGEYSLLLHGGSRIEAHGRGETEVVQLDEQHVRLRAPDFTMLRVYCQVRAHEIVLPDGSALTADAADVVDGPVDVLLQRDGDRAFVFNNGRRPAVLRTPFGDRELPPGQRLYLLLAPPREPIAAGLGHHGVVVQRQGPRLLVQGGQGGSLHWSGARFDLPPGASLRLDPLQGRPFDQTP